MMKKSFVALILAIQLLLVISGAFADGVIPRADEVFVDANAVLYRGKYVLFTAVSTEVIDSVSVTSVKLEQKVNGEWSVVRSLPCPPNQTSCLRYSKTVYYTSQITTGTFRIVATFSVDGHLTTRTSNECTF